MVIKEDGTKWACQSCLKGHRVSGCNHTDRELHFVPKKGRPVTQCSHCRRERRNRSHHVRCGCGEKDTSNKKCIHLLAKDGHPSEGDGHDHDPASEGDSHGLGPVPEGEESDEHSCCCHHGEKCRCTKAYQKQAEGTEHARTLDKATSKPRLTSTTSEGSVSTLGSGHHKPVARNHSAHDVNSAYRVHKSHATHHAIHGVHPAGRRSVDSLATTEKSAKVVRPHLHNLAPAPGKTMEQIKADATDHLADNSHAAFSIPVDYLLPSGHEELFASLPDGDQDFSPVFDNTSQIPDRSNGLAPIWADRKSGIWTGLHYMNTNMSETSQPALTYASSNTISEFGEHTPPEELKKSLGERGAASESLDSTEPLFKTNSQAWGNDDGQQSRHFDSQQNRWSLPPSYWTNMDDVTNFLDFGSAARSGGDDGQIASSLQQKSSYLSRTAGQGVPTRSLAPTPSTMGNDDRKDIGSALSAQPILSNSGANNARSSAAMYNSSQSSLPTTAYHFENYATLGVGSSDGFDFTPARNTNPDELAGSYQSAQAADPFFGVDPSSMDGFSISGGDMAMVDLDEQWPS